MNDEIRFSDDYAKVYEAVSKIPQELDDKKLDVFVNLIPKDRKYKILDLGCAEGKLAVRLASEGHAVTASDISTNYLRQTSQLALNKKVRLETVLCDVEGDVSCFPNSFDFIFMMDVLEHLRSPIKGLENLSELLEPEGSLFIDTPNACSVSNFAIHVWNRRKVTNLREGELTSLHLQIYDLLTLEKVCNFAGLNVKRVIPTKVGIPRLVRSRTLARVFPALSESLLIECARFPKRMNLEKWVAMWDAEKYVLEHSRGSAF
jgi:2-polyprenyl-3-methyl-5-hydroxy-6-metoxy-1,4-benzoquinol methylase